MQKKDKVDFYRLVENAKDIIFRMRLPENAYQYISPAAAAITGYPCEEFYATPFLLGKIVHPAWQAYCGKYWEKCNAGQAPDALDYQIVMKSGEIRWLSQRCVIIRDQQGKPVAIEGIATDVTAQKNYLQASIEAKDKAETANQAKSSFLAYMSHELRTPLNAVIGFSDLLLANDVLGENESRWVQCISAAGRHILSLISDLLNLSMIEMGRSEISRQYFDAISAIRETVLLHQHLAQTKNIMLQLDLVDSCFILADRRRFVQIVINLLTNALKFSKNGGRVRVTGQKEGGKLLVAVWDDGPGISPAKQSEIFKEFACLAESMDVFRHRQISERMV